MTGPFFQRRPVADDSVMQARADNSASVDAAQTDASATSTVALPTDQEVLANANPLPTDPPPASRGGDQADPMTLVHDGGEPADSHRSFVSGVDVGRDESSAEPLLASERTDSTQAIPLRVCRKCSTQSQISGEFCPHCGGRFTRRRAGRKPKTDAAPARATSASSPREHRQSGTASRAQLILLPIVGILAIVGLGLGLFALINQPSTAPLQREVNLLKAIDASQHEQISSLQTETAALKTATASAATAGNLTALQTSVGGLTTTVKGVQGDLSTLHTCLPELSQEVNGLTVNTYNTGGYLTDAYLSNPTIISTNCTKFLTGHQ